MSNSPTKEPMKYCGGDHCSGLWNLGCDDLTHNLPHTHEAIQALLTAEYQLGFVDGYEEDQDALVEQAYQQGQRDVCESLLRSMSGGAGNQASIGFVRQELAELEPLKEEKE